MQTFYSIVYTLAFILASPYWLIRGFFNREYLRTLRAKFIGPGKVLPKLDDRKRIWVWALSLGEVLSARELIRDLLNQGCEVVVTATTLSGLNSARTSWPTLAVYPSPLDFNTSIRRFLDLVSPDMLILVETDIWPGILLELKNRNIPKVLVSARLSPRSFKNYKRIGFFWKKIIRLFDRIASQTEEDRKKFMVLGIDPDKITVTGNLKFDQPPAPAGAQEKAAILQETGWPDGRWLVAGSTHMGEERLILNAFAQIALKIPSLKLLIAPRDRHRFSLTWRYILQSFPNLSAKRSQPQPSDAQARVFLLDTLGELERYYSLAEVALIGKSWPESHQTGGHNPLEASVRGKPVIAGPKIQNFKWIYQALVQAGGAKIIESAALATQLAQLLASPQTTLEMGLKAVDFVTSHRGSVKETLKFINQPPIF
jgi:3-deoxy-D-manno-octulosonic-acid transferase